MMRRDMGRMSFFLLSPSLLTPPLMRFSNTTASQAAMEGGSAVIALICACAARASMQAPDQRHGEPSSHGGDRVRHVPFGSDRRRRGVGNPRKGAALRNPRRDLGLRGENLARSAIRKP